jgi:hypothetical protein
MKNGNPFWNAEEKRVRAVWRLLIQTIIFVLLTFCLGTALTTPLFFTMDTENLDLNNVQSVSQQFMAQPGFRLMNMLGTLLATLGSIWLAGRFLDKRRFTDFGFHLDRNWWLDLGFGLALGAVLMAGIYGIEQAAGWITVTEMQYVNYGNLGFWLGILFQVLVYLSVGIYEELLMRGYYLQNIAEGLHGPKIGYRVAILIALLVSSGVFGLAHLGNPNADLISTTNIALAGVFLGLGYVLTGELAIPIGLHITWNFFQGNVFGFPVSGTTSHVSFIAIEQGGPGLWTGGDFGPEAGLLGIAAMIIGSLLTVVWVQVRRGETRLQRVLATYNPSQAPGAEPSADAEPEFEETEGTI